MIDLKRLRAEPDRYREALARRGAADDVDRLLVLDERRRSPPQLVIDLDELDAAVIAAGLPEKPMRVLWKAP